MNAAKEALKNNADLFPHLNYQKKIVERSMYRQLKEQRKEERIRERRKLLGPDPEEEDYGDMPEKEKAKIIEEKKKEQKRILEETYLKIREKKKEEWRKQVLEERKRLGLDDPKPSPNGPRPGPSHGGPQPPPPSNLPSSYQRHNGNTSRSQPPWTAADRSTSFEIKQEPLDFGTSRAPPPSKNLFVGQPIKKETFGPFEDGEVISSAEEDFDALEEKGNPTSSLGDVRIKQENEEFPASESSRVGLVDYEDISSPDNN